MRGRPASPAAPAPSPVGYTTPGSLAAPPQWVYCPWSLLPSHPFPSENPGSSCSAGQPLPGEGFSCGHRQAAWGLVLAGVVCSESSICSPHPLFFHLDESPGRGEAKGGVAVRVPRDAELLGTASPGPGGTARASCSSQSLQSSALALGTFGSVPSGCCCSRAPLQVLLIAGRGDSQCWELFSGCCW